jgi:ubiquinone/menaquinone biosynthesis C-methylase UbiE
MYNFFKCSKCGQAMTLPSCSCGYAVGYKDGIYQLTDAPYIVKDDSADAKYIGYEDIGEYYSGKSLFFYIFIDGKYKKTAEIIGNGTLLHLACGDGLFTVPLVSQGVPVISMDISDKMLSLLYKRAEIAGIDPSRFTVCRANALDIPLIDNSVDAAIANSMLHLISTPEIVVKDIHRVLKTGGKLITFEDRPNVNPFKNNDNLTEEEKAENKKADEFNSFIYGRYFNILKDEYNIFPKRYSWKFDREKVCTDIFSNKIIYTVENKREKEKNIFKDTSFYRMGGKGYSDQSDVPNDIHKSVFARVTAEFISEYGEESLNIGWTICDCLETTDIIVYIK